MTQKNPRPVTRLQDLADLAGVSRATASRALSDSPLISDKTKLKIRTLAEKHNYRINRQARGLRLQQRGVVSVVFMLDRQSDQHMSDPFFLEMLGSIADSLADHDYDLLLAHAPIQDVRALPESRVIRDADGVIFVGQGEHHAELNRIADGGTPVVVWGGPVPDKRYVLVSSDNLAGGFAATDHLLTLGRRRVAFFGSTRNPEIAMRFEGYRNALAAHDVAPSSELVFDVPFDMHNAREATRHVLEAAHTFDALVCASDVMALAAISALADHGMSTPADVSVVGYDDIALASYGNPSLTTVRQNIGRAGNALVTSLLGLLGGGDVGDTQLPSELIVRESSVPP